ncbi:MAG: YbaK/EbsC family protein, partial [Dehalococcoidales bacterium]|nr:YbaK/EbsC family protein [Dehalococcoidales bacterium]
SLIELLSPLLGIMVGQAVMAQQSMQSDSASGAAENYSRLVDDIAQAATGYPTGGIPPVGHKKKLPVFLDEGLLIQEYVWCGGGARSKLVKLKTEDIVRLNAATVCDLSAE